MDSGKYFVPGALPEVVPLAVSSPSPQLPHVEFVARDYEFTFVPQHFFHHFCAKAFWFSEATVSAVWKRGMELRLLPQKVGHKEELARVTWDPTRYVLKLMIETRFCCVISGRCYLFMSLFPDVLMQTMDFTFTRTSC